MSIQLRHAVNAKRGASAAPFSWKWPASPAGAVPLPREEGEPAPGGPSRRGQIRRTMRPPRGRPSCRAGDLAAGHKGTRTPRASRGGWGRPRGKPAARTKLRPRVSSARSAQRAAGTGRQREGPRGAAEWEVGAGGGGGGRLAPGSWPPRELGLGKSGHPAGRLERCPRCWLWVAPRDRSSASAGPTMSRGPLAPTAVRWAVAMATTEGVG